MNQDLETGDVIPPRKPAIWEDFFATFEGTDVPADFLEPAERNQEMQDRDLFADWHE